MGISLYELTKEMEAVLDGGFVVDEETGEVLFDSENLEQLEGAYNDKLEAVAIYFKNLNAEAAAIKEEEKRLSERRKAAENKAERLKEYMLDSMIDTGTTSLETARVKLSTRKSEAVVITDESIVPEMFLKTKVTVDKTEIKKAIKAGDAVTGAYLEMRQNLQVK